MSKISRVLSAIEQGDTTAAERPLRCLAAQNLAREPSGLTLQPTAPVHEAYIRLMGGGPPEGCEGRAHFFAAAAGAMRRILVEGGRSPPGRRPVVRRIARAGRFAGALAAANPRAAGVVKLLFFGGGPG